MFGVEVKKLDGDAPFFEGAAEAAAPGLVGGGGCAAEEAPTGLRPRTSEGLSEAGSCTSRLACRLSLHGGFGSAHLHGIKYTRCFAGWWKSFVSIK